MGLVPMKACATIRIVRSCAVLLALLLFSPVDLTAQDPLGEARRLYNAGDWEAFGSTLTDDFVAHDVALDREVADGLRADNSTTPARDNGEPSQAE